MDVIVASKAILGFVSVVTACVSCAYWYRSSKAEVLMDGPMDDIGIGVEGKTIAWYATSKKQSQLGAKGALFAAMAAASQLIPMVVDTWLAFVKVG